MNLNPPKESPCSLSCHTVLYLHQCSGNNDEKGCLLPTSFWFPAMLTASYIYYIY